MYTAVTSLGLEGIAPYLVHVEVDSRTGLPGFDIVGLPDAAVKESRDRVGAALRNLGYPAPNSKIIANLAPADTRKVGSIYDLPILMGLTGACGYENFDFSGTALIGEIGLAGEIRGVPGVLPMVLDAAKMGVGRVVVPLDNLPEAVVVGDIQVYGAAHCRDVIAFFRGDTDALTPASQAKIRPVPQANIPDFAEVKGQPEAKWALKVAAAGGHNVLLIGAPGAGKSMLARRLPSILPEMTDAEAIETTKIYSAAGQLAAGAGLMRTRPFRAPHHSASAAALAGGGTTPKPGDISLAHNGVLFLDELPEFSKAVLETLRQPLEDGVVSISRVRQRVQYPGDTMLVAAMNPCPCGYFGVQGRACRCAPSAVARYLSRVSGPLLDRIDIHVEVLPVKYEQLAAAAEDGTSAEMRSQVKEARARQTERYKGTGVPCNARLTPAMLQEHCQMDAKASALLKSAFERMGLSARGYDRIVKVARTIADLDGSEAIVASHIAQAVQLRSLDRKYWAG